MADLFDQLKAAGPVKKLSSSPAKSAVSLSKNNFSLPLEVFDDEEKSKSSVIRRESLPSPITVSDVLKKSDTQKARSLSPTKQLVNNIKSLKVKLERKKLEEFLTRPLEEHANNIRKKQEKIKDANKQPKVTPTKAQQKLFEPSLVNQKISKAQIYKDYNIKPCKVRIRRDNLQKLANEFKNKNISKKHGKSKPSKRSAQSSAESPPLKKTKLSVLDNKSSKSKNSFFIKLNTSPSSTKIEKKLKNISRKSASSEAHHNKIKNSKFDTITAPTKFSRSQLLRSFGKRFFNVQVKIERCTHPLMLTFESNNRARRLQGKRNKSKNLSVSFQEQVEIFGDSSDSDDNCDQEFCANPTSRNGRKNNGANPIPATLTTVVMPARLKKVENGKVVDDIELDPSLFVDPKILISSTPFSPGRKKRDHKSYSPLKDESLPSPRKEQLKLANEKIPPTGLRRLNVDEDDDEDDDCEYIVPIEMPQRRTSHTSSNATLDDFISEPMALPDSPVNFAGIFDDKTDFNTNKNDTEIYNKDRRSGAKNDVEKNYENGSDDSFQSARDIAESNSRDNAFPSLRISPIYEFQPQLETNKTDQQANGNVCNEASNKHLSSLNSVAGISVNLFMEDSQTNEDDTHSKSFVDSIINETIDKLSKDIEEDKQYSGKI